MRKSFKNSWLSICLLASVAMVGCGGGGGGGGNPAAPVNTTSKEALAAKAVVSPVLQNADTILNGGGKTNASSRLSINGTNAEQFSISSTNNAVMTALEAPDFIRAIISVAGGNIEGGLWVDANNYMESYTVNPYLEVASYSGKVYERTLYFNPEYHGDSNEGTPEIAAHYIIDNCNAVLENKTLKSLIINPNAKITIEEYQKGSLGKKYKKFIKGTIDSDLTAKWVGEEITYKDSESFIINPWSGEKIENNPNNDSYYYTGFKVSGKTTSNTTYTLSKPIKLKLTKFYDRAHHFDSSIWNDNGYQYSEKIDEYDSDNLEITISGIKGSITEKKVSYSGDYVEYNGSSWNKPDYDYYRNGNLVFREKLDKDNISFSSPVKVTLAGSLINKLDNQSTSYTYGDGQENTSDPTHVVTRNASIKNITVSLNKISGKIDTIVVDNAEAHVEIESYTEDKAIMIGDMEVLFNKAKIDITGLKYDYRWKPKSEKTIPIIDPEYGYWMGSEDNEEYKKEKESMYKNCFGNAIVHLEAEETKNSVTIKADCDINKKTATLNLVNNGEYVVKDNNNGILLEFNFKTVEINATKVDVLANNKCEGAKLVVTGVEKDGTKSERTYNVVKGKLVLDTKSQKDKQAPASLPDVQIANIPNELSDSNSIETAVSEAKPSEEIMKDPTNESLKVGKKGDLNVASYNKKQTKDSKELNTKISAKNKLIAAVSFYGNKEYTLVFVIDYSDAKHPQIKGSIFSGQRNNVTIDTVENKIAQFAGKDGNITVITSAGASTVNVQ